jgi:hypothetical protein
VTSTLPGQQRAPAIRAIRCLQRTETPRIKSGAGVMTPRAGQGSGYKIR